MDALTVKKALQTIVEAHAMDITFSTKINEVLDGKEDSVVYFLLKPLTGEIIEDGGLYTVYNVEAALFQKMDTETDESERDESLSMLGENMKFIFQEFYRRHIVSATTVNGLSLSATLTTPPEMLVDWNRVPDNENLVKLNFSIQDELPISCSTVNALFSY